MRPHVVAQLAVSLDGVTSGFDVDLARFYALAVVDSRARVREWEALRQLGYWSDVLALYADQTPARPPDAKTRELVAGYEQVDLVEVLDILGERGVHTIRVDSGGALVSALLDRGLIDELALLVHPVLVGTGNAGATPGNWIYGMPARRSSKKASSGSGIASPPDFGNFRLGRAVKLGTLYGVCGK